MKVYIAAQYSQKLQIHQYKLQLEELGFTVTSTWTLEPDNPNVSLKDVSEKTILEYAERDVKEVDDADLLVLFTVDPDMPVRRGGRHVEFGMALAAGKKLAVVGPQENMFHKLPYVSVFSTWDDFVVWLKGQVQ